MFQRVRNRIRAEWSYLLSHVGIVRVNHLPTFVSIEPANFCQLSCPECPVGMRHDTPHVSRSLLSLDMFRRILDEIAPTALTLQLYFQGEPLLNPDLPEMVRLAHQKGLFTVVSTNAQALTEGVAEALSAAGLNRIILSIDGFSEDSYAAYRQGGDLHKALMALQYLRRAKRGLFPIIELQVLRLKTNEHEWHWVKKHYRAMGADKLTFKTAQFYDFEKGNPLMPTNERYSRYRLGEDGLYHPKRKVQRHLAVCKRLWTGCVITTSGNVLPCCYDKASQFVLGNISKQSLKDIFCGAKAQRFRRQVLLSPSSVSICHNCDQ